MNPAALSIIIISLGLGTTITFMSSHWLLAWMGLEINTLAIIPLMLKNHHPRAAEASTKYFLTQATAAALVLFSATMNAWSTGMWEIQQMSDQVATTITTLALGLKLGIAPMHFWLPEVLQGLDLTTGLVLSTWQKMAPMALIYQLSQEMNQELLTTLGLLSILIGGWGGLNQTQLRKIMAYSSIAHMGWMIIVLKYSPNLMLMNLTIYIIMTSTAFMLLNTTSTTKINTMALTWTKAPIVMVLMMTTLLSLGGLPPLTGFMPKWLIVQELTKQELPLTASIMMMAALLSLFFYLRICYAMSLTIFPNINNMKMSWRSRLMKKTIPLSIMMVLTTTMLPMTPTMLTMTT
uniref:NADH-ubiquinone oxidoreductase chain 2 n=1 Tax=Kaupichthys hyoproroides TaxID=139721 RepID=D1YTG5_KAUHY|nr:NADH dehydrogenase subunit 2 [Kaupichthys hyoproroides]BAI53199.1 NADH dehydrogenase subunit 2 [Kaupichthys hyoproroides]